MESCSSKLAESAVSDSRNLNRSGIPKLKSTSTLKIETIKATANRTTSTIPKSNNENKPPPRPNLTRSTTTVTMRKNVIVPRVVSKRPAAVTNNTNANKKPRITTKTTINNTRSTATTKPTTNAKSVVKSSTEQKLDLNNLIDRPKPNKWDLKGRLEYATEELNIVKQKYSQIEEEYNSVKSILIDCQKVNDDLISKNEKLETENVSLVQGKEELELRMTELTEEINSLNEIIKELEESEAKTEKCLAEKMKEYEVMEKQLSEMKQEHTKMEQDIKLNEEMIKEFKINRDHLQDLVHKLDQDRRILHNTIQDLKGNIRVFCRVRPRTEKELDRKLCTMNFIDSATIEVGRHETTQESYGKIRTAKQEFSFDKVFPPSATQEQVFEELELLVQSALEGYNVCVFAYGQTGSGKTYTMEGNRTEESEGMIPRTVRHIFKEMKGFELMGWEYSVELSIFEIYNEHIVDLLNSEAKTHEIRMVDGKKNDLYVTNLHIEQIDCPEKLHECLLIAHKNRAVAATSSNERSSRSHSVTKIKLIGKHATNKEICIGNLNLVDLAGSERLKNEEASRTVETKNINKSLSNLGNVILALLRKQDHIPYRNSKLTHILMPSLGGNSKTLMLLNVSPLDDCYNETLNSLRFASTVNSCRVNNAKRQKIAI